MTTNVRRLMAKPKRVWEALDIGNTRGYELVAEGKLELVKDGRASFITWESVESYVASLRTKEAA